MATNRIGRPQKQAKDEDEEKAFQRNEFATKNPAADPRRMRRIIAEDPEWSLATVPDLLDICIMHIVGNFQDNPLLDELKPKHKKKVLEMLSTKLPLKVTAPLIEDEGFWQRSCKSRWEVCDVSNHGNSWKRMFFERNLQGLIENFVPEATDPKELNETLMVSSKFIKCLRIQQLLLPINDGTSNEDDASDTTSEVGGGGPSCNHIDFGIVFRVLPKLEEIHITYGVKNCGMNFDWSLFKFTEQDCSLLAKAVKSCRSLTVFHLHRSNVTDEKSRTLISHFLEHPCLETLDLSHNKIGDGGARALGKLLVSKCRLKSLNVANNQIGSHGGGAIGHALQKNSKLLSLNLRLNRLSDEGGFGILKALLKNATLTTLHLGSNELGELSAQAMNEVALQNSTLTSIDLTSNPFGDTGGRLLHEGLEENTTIVNMDLRQTNVGEENEYCISQILKRNQNKAAGW
ncbi:dynein regulatory complex subunit 5-like [Corticium candelabrum]|uniref:dynein regulatory complex subunit 5-like n=1 Tax=Corticium candelabrum TaxID=121492 RepID=UPI002E26BC83|nr:dynein regulatory complex subunit 5-like [Corticium candelabrum]